MEEFLKNARSPSWLISTVVVGLVVSVAASYIKSWIDGRYSSWSAVRRARRQAQQKKFEEDVTRIVVGDTRGLLHGAAQEQRLYFQSLIFLGPSAVAAASVPVMGLILAGVCLLVFFLQAREAFRWSTVMVAAWEKQPEPRKLPNPPVP
jgi:hypothetical protein